VNGLAHKYGESVSLLKSLFIKEVAGLRLAPLHFYDALNGVNLIKNCPVLYLNA